MIAWVVLVLCIAVVLRVGIERLIARLGVHREEGGLDGLAEVAEHLERWSNERHRK